MRGWKERWISLTSVLICALVVVVGTLLYPLIFVAFSGMALVHPLYRRLRPSSEASGHRLPRGDAGR